MPPPHGRIDLPDITLVHGCLDLHLQQQQLVQDVRNQLIAKYFNPSSIHYEAISPREWL
jgi:hypothetical protein